MKIGLRGGHSPNCKGAVGCLDEQRCVRTLYYKLKALLKAQGHTIIDCNSNANNVSGELTEGTNKCNVNHCDLYIPLHMNASNGVGNGVECWTYSSNSYKANEIGNRICTNLSSLGLQNRGVKHSKKLHDTRCTKCQTCLIEILFCDNKHDCDIWNNIGINKIVTLIASAICNKKINNKKKVKKVSGNTKTYKKYDETIPEGANIFKIPNTQGYIEQTTDGRLIVHYDRGNYIAIGKGIITANWDDNKGHRGSKKISD